MAALYITSSARGSGKTTLCCGLGKYFLDRGKKVGFFKPTFDATAPPGSIDSDAELIKTLLALEEPVELLCPVLTDQSNIEARLKETYGRVSQDKDIVLIEGIPEKKIAESLGAKVVIIESYSKELPSIANGYKNFDSLLGVVLNKVPANRLEHVRSEIATRFDHAGINILGILPEARSLLTLSIGELVEHIQGKFLSGSDKSSELVENIMLGPMGLDSGLHYYGYKSNKAVIIESKRSDMQLAALGTSVKCLIIVGDKAPHPVVLHQAEDKKVPVILAEGDVTKVVTNIENSLSETKFNREKLPKLVEIMEQHFNFSMLAKAL